MGRSTGCPLSYNRFVEREKEMKEITVNGNDYKLEFSFEAAERKDFVSMMENPTPKDMINGTINMVSDIPHICRTGFFVGLMENNPVPETEAKALMKAYMKENKIGYADLYEDLRKCMEEDGFFELSGITKMLNQMAENQKPRKVPQDHKQKSTGTK